MTESQLAAFEVIDPATGHRWMVYPDGQVRGFGPSVIVVNRIPALVLNAIGERDTESLMGTQDQSPPAPDLKFGDRVTVEIPQKRPFNGVIAGEGRGGEWWIIIKDGTKSKNGYSKDFCHHER